MVALPDPTDALMALLSRRRAIHRIDGLSARLKVDADELATLLDVALDEGRVELWPDAPGGPSVLMSALEARRRGLVLDGGHEELTHRWRWVRPGQLKPLRATSIVEADLVDAAGGFDRMADRPQAGDSLADRWTAVVDRLGAGDPVINVTLVLGIGLQWPVARRPDGPCPGCSDRPLGMLAVCVVCHRSGADHLFKPIPRAMLPKPPKAERADDKLTGGKGKSKAGKLKVKAKGRGKRAELVAVAG